MAFDSTPHRAVRLYQLPVTDEERHRVVLQEGVDNAAGCNNQSAEVHHLSQLTPDESTARIVSLSIDLSVRAVNSNTPK